MRSKDPLMKKRVGVRTAERALWGREDHGRKKEERESEMERTHDGRDWLRPAPRHCSPGLWFHFCKVHNLSETQRVLTATSHLCKQAASWMWPWAPRGSWKESWAHFLSLVSSKEGTCCRILWLQKGDPFSLHVGRNVTKESEELRLHYHKVPRGLKVQEKRAWLTTSGARGFIELVMKIIFAKYSENIW